MRVLEKDAAIKRWERYRSLRIPYKKANGSRGYYNPDFIVQFVDGTKEIHEVKGTHLLNDENNIRKLKAGQAFCKKRGMVFKVVSKKT